MVAEESVVGRLVRDRVVIDRLGAFKDVVELFYSKNFFGSLDKSSLILSLPEALYLLDSGKISIVDYRGKSLSYSSFADRVSRVDKRFLSKFLVFKDLRSRGYFLRSALKYGADFLVYDRGKSPGKNHSKWLLFVSSQDDRFSWRSWIGNNRVAHSVKKSALVAIVDGSGEITYYQIDWFRP